MFFNFKPNFIEKFVWETGFSNFGHVTVLRNDDLFWNETFLIVLFASIVLVADILLFWVYTHFQNSCKKVLKNEWVHVDPPPSCAQTGVKSSLGT